MVSTYDTYGLAYAESQARFREALDILRRAWTGEPFSHQGEFYRVDNATVAPRPYQVPHPPIRMAATSDETFPMAGRLGLPIFIGLRATEISDLQTQLGPYRDAWREAGHPGEPSVYLRLPVYASPTADGAREEPRESLTSFFARQTELARQAVGRAGAGPADRRRMQAERMAAPLLRRHPRAQGRLRHRARGRRSADRAAGRARDRRGGGRAEPGRSHPSGARGAQPRDPHPRGRAGPEGG